MENLTPDERGLDRSVRLFAYLVDTTGPAEPYPPLRCNQYSRKTPSDRKPLTQNPWHRPAFQYITIP